MTAELRTIIVAVMAISVCCTVHAADTEPIIGAIRWDAWHAGAGPADAMRKSLAPKQYHYRLPFFARVISDSEIEIGGYTQEIVDREIAFAKAGGIDYWAFLLYGPDTPMSQGLSLYRSSEHKKDIRFCAIVQSGRFAPTGAGEDGYKGVIDLMAWPEYQTVADGRPLFYVFNVTDERIEAWGGEAGARKLFDDFRAKAQARGMKTPYIVVLDTKPAHGHKIARTLGAEAISSYAVAGDHGKGGKPYAALAEVVGKFWDDCLATGSDVVPLAMAGWDRRPRIEHPVPWEKYQKPGEGIENFYHAPTPKELAGHIKDAMTVAEKNVGKCPAQAVLVYAWNEHDEGGWLCPTLGPDGSANTERLDAIAAMKAAKD